MPTMWRMQLHPAEPEKSTQCCVESLAAGFIGLDFSEDIGDLRKTRLERLPRRQRDYRDFATKMRRGDIVLIMAHHFPFALVRVDGKYNYIARSDESLGIWFRHFRRVKDVRYFADWQKNAKRWPQIVMTDAISVLKSATSISARLIARWLKEQ